MKPLVRPCAAKPMISAAPMRSAASCAASGARSGRGCDVSRISMTRRCSSRLRRYGKRSSCSPRRRLGIERCEQAGHADDVLDRAVARIESCNQQRVEPRGLAQRFEIQAQQRVSVLVGEILEIDRRLGEQDVESSLGAAHAGRYAKETTPRRCAGMPVGGLLGLARHSPLLRSSVSDAGPTRRRVLLIIPSSRLPRRLRWIVVERGSRGADCVTAKMQKKAQSAGG